MGDVHAERLANGLAQADERIRQLEKQCEVLAAEVDRMRPVMEAACRVHRSGELAALDIAVIAYEASNPK